MLNNRSEANIFFIEVNVPILTQTYKGKKYLVADYRGMKASAEMLKLLAELAKELDKATNPVLDSIITRAFHSTRNI
jgi:hypothetical protein